MKYQNQGDNNWQLTPNNYACWHSTFFSFSFIVPIMHRFWKYRTGVAVQLSVCVAWSAGQNRTDHACPSILRFCAFHCASTFVLNFYVHSCFTCQPDTPTDKQKFPQLKYHCQQQ